MAPGILKQILFVLDLSTATFKFKTLGRPHSSATTIITIADTSGDPAITMLLRRKNCLSSHNRRDCESQYG